MGRGGRQVRGVVLRGRAAGRLQGAHTLSAAIAGPAELRDRYRSLCRVEDDKPIDCGSLKDFGNDFSVVIGRRWPTAEAEGGRQLQLVSPSKRHAAASCQRAVQARVAAVFCAGMYDYDANFVYAPLTESSACSIGDKVTGIEVFVATIRRSPPRARQLSQVVGMQGWVFDWWQATSALRRDQAETTSCSSC